MNKELIEEKKLRLEVLKKYKKSLMKVPYAINLKPVNDEIWTLEKEIEGMGKADQSEIYKKKAQAWDKLKNELQFVVDDLSKEKSLSKSDSTELHSFKIVLKNMNNAE